MKQKLKDRNNPCLPGTSDMGQTECKIAWFKHVLVSHTSSLQN